MSPRNRRAQELWEQVATQDSNCHAEFSQILSHFIKVQSQSLVVFVGKSELVYTSLIIV